MPDACRCGWTGEGHHLCHRCHAKPGTTKFYAPSMAFSLAGAQLKFSMTNTNACEPCWTEFEKLLAAQRRPP